MGDYELDEALAERFKAYGEGVRLSGESKRRFVVSVRRKRALRRVCTIGLVCATVAACVAVAGLTKPAVPDGDAQPSLTARAGNTNRTAKVSCWMLLGYLRECLGRSRPFRRKEEEE